MTSQLHRVLRHAAMVGAALSAGCLDDRSVSPNAINDTPVRLALQANVVGAAAGQTVRIRTFYRRVDGSTVTLENTPSEVAVTPGVSQTVAVQVRVARCLADDQRVGAGEPACGIGVELSLLDERGTIIDQQATAPSQGTPGSSITISQPVTLADIATVTVAAVPALRVGDARTMTATATDASGGALTRTFTWTSDNASVLTINPATGAATAVASGSARVTATTGVKSGSATVRVIRRVASVTLSPDPAPSVRAAATLTFVATPKDANGADAGDLADRTVTWTATNPAGSTRTASVSVTGVVTGVFPGDADITVSIDGVTKTSRVRVTAGGIRVTPAALQLIAGGTQTLQATVVDANGGTLAGVPVSWSSSNTSVATVNAAGSVTAVAIGAATITVSGGGVNSTVPVTVGSSVLTVTPPSATVVAGNTMQLNVSGALGTVTWQSSNTAVATVSATGVVSARFPGRTAISATVTTPNGTQRGGATIDVDVADLTITPSSAVVLEGRTVQFTATARDTRGVVLVGVPIGWSVSDPQVATVNADGLVSAHAPTEVPIFVRAVVGSKSAAASLFIEYDSRNFRPTRATRGNPVSTAPARPPRGN